jgi:hypothetical protein
MGWFGQLARTIGQTGTDIAAGQAANTQQQEAKRRLDMAGQELQLEQARQQLANLQFEQQKQMWPLQLKQLQSQQAYLDWQQRARTDPFGLFNDIYKRSADPKNPEDMAIINNFVTGLGWQPSSMTRQPGALTLDQMFNTDQDINTAKQRILAARTRLEQLQKEQPGMLSGIDVEGHHIGRSQADIDKDIAAQQSVIDQQTKLIKERQGILVRQWQGQQGGGGQTEGDTAGGGKADTTGAAKQGPPEPTEDNWSDAPPSTAGGPPGAVATTTQPGGGAQPAPAPQPQPQRQPQPSPGPPGSRVSAPSQHPVTDTLLHGLYQLDQWAKGLNSPNTPIGRWARQYEGKNQAAPTPPGQSSVLVNIVNRLEGPGTNFGQTGKFKQDYGSGPLAVNNYARQVLAAHPDATFGEFYGSYVTDTGRAKALDPNVPLPNAKQFQTLRPDAYSNMITHAGIDPNTLLSDLIGAA